MGWEYGTGLDWVGLDGRGIADGIGWGWMGLDGTGCNKPWICIHIIYIAEQNVTDDEYLKMSANNHNSPHQRNVFSTAAVHWELGLVSRD